MTRIPTVTELIANRRTGESDDYVLGLALEGGGMRGVVSGSMLIALRDLGAENIFDRHYGTSSGAINLAYFYAGQGWDGLSIYYDHLTRGFIRPAAARLTAPTLNMTYAFDDVMVERVPLDTRALARAPKPIQVVLTDVKAVKAEVVDLRSCASEAVAYLKASSWLPLLSGAPLKLHQRTYLDGGIVFPDPVYAAMADGCTHVLILNTASQGDDSAHSPRSRRILQVTLNNWAAGLGDVYVRSRLRWDADRARVGFERETRLDGIRVYRLAPRPNAHKVGRLTTDRAALLDGARAGYETVLRWLDRDRPAYFSVTTHS